MDSVANLREEAQQYLDNPSPHKQDRLPLINLPKTNKQQSHQSGKFNSSLFSLQHTTETAFKVRDKNFSVSQYHVPSRQARKMGNNSMLEASKSQLPHTNPF